MWHIWKTGEMHTGEMRGKRPLGRRRHIWEDNSKMDIQAVEWGGMDWIDLARDVDGWQTLVNAVTNLQVL
jgi:hypothetical protein